MQNEEVALEPCPFCGGVAELIERRNPMSKWRWSVDCKSSTCGMSGPVEANKMDAVAAWNRREHVGSSEPAAWMYEDKYGCLRVWIMRQSMSYVQAVKETPLYTRTPQADLLEAVAVLKWYADTFCERGKYAEVCGRLTDDDCSGCKARAFLAKIGERK